jgi:hypothetical protein
MLHQLFHPWFFQPAVLTLTENHQFAGKDQPGNRPDPELHSKKLHEQTEKIKGTSERKMNNFWDFF